MKALGHLRTNMQLPPKLKYRFEKWRRAHLAQSLQPKTPKLGDLQMSEIKKHDAQVSFYKSDVVRMDFGSNVDPKTKQMAMAWAKKKGLNIVDESLQKGANAIHTIIFCKNINDIGPDAKPLKTIIL